MERIPYLGHTIFKWRVGASTFLAMPEHGARLMNWNVTLGDGSIRDVIYWPELQSLENIGSIRGGNPILFPFAGRTYDDGEIHQWRAEDGVRRPMPMHGIARQGQFRITRLDEGGFSAQLLPDREAQAAYPYDYEFVVSYRFDPVALFVELQLTNHGTTPIPWSAGHHFYFTIPWSGTRVRADYLLEATSTRSYRRNERGALVSVPSLGARVTLDQKDLVDLIQTGLRRDVFSVTERSTNSRLFFRMSMAGSPAKELSLVTWTSDDTAPYYCVEPWMGPPNAPETKVGLHHVAPGQTQKFYVEISLS